LFTHGTHGVANFKDQEWSYKTVYTESSPKAYVKFAGYNFESTADPLLLMKLVQLKDGEDYLMARLAKEIESRVEPENYESVFFGVQIEAERLQYGPKTLKKLKVSSKLSRSSNGRLAESIVALIEAFTTELINRVGTDEYTSFFHENNDSLYSVYNLIVILIMGSAKSGGCLESKQCPKVFLPYVFQPRVRDNLCFFSCISYYLHLNNGECNTASAIRYRDMLGFKPSQPVYFAEMDKIAHTLNVTLVIYEKEKHTTPIQGYGSNLIKTKTIGNGQNIVNLLFWKSSRYGHFYLIKSLEMLLKFKMCWKCCDWLKSDSEAASKHIGKCRVCTYCRVRINDASNHSCRIKNPKVPFRCLEEQTSFNENQDWVENIYVSDFETYPDERGFQTVYAAAVAPISSLIDPDKLSEDNITHEFWGQNTIELFFDWLLSFGELGKKEKPKIFCIFYNGSKFDFWFILQEAVHRGYRPSKIMKCHKTNKIMSLVIGKVKLWDLCLFTLCKLSDLCNDFKIPGNFHKQEYDIGKIKSMAIANENKTDIQKYLRFDVLSLGLCYIVFAKQIWDTFQINVINAITLSHLAFVIWSSRFMTQEELKHMKLVGPTEYNFLRMALYGGRVTPQKPICLSSMYDTEEFTNWPNLSEARRRKFIDDNLTNQTALKYVDANSLYPFTGYSCKFPAGGFYWFKDYDQHMKMLNHMNEGNLSSAELYYIQRSFFKVDVECPNDLLIPFLFSKDEHGKLAQNLHKKIAQVYDGFSLLHAAKLGYKVTNFYEGLRFGRLVTCLKAFMEKLHKLKQENRDNPAAYAIYKYIMNGLTGKYNQKWAPIDSSIELEDTWLEQVGEDNYEYIDKIEPFFENQVFKGFFVVMRNDNEPSKPLQIGVSLLAQSRIIMSDYCIQLGSYRNPDCQVLYCDTDSLVIYRKCWEAARVKYPGSFGSEFGQLKDEVAGGLIVAAVFLAPKTYIYYYIDIKTTKVYAGIRSKGIPMPSKIVDRSGKFLVHYQPSVCDAPSERDLRTVSFALCEREPDSEGNIQVRKYLPIPKIEDFISMYEEDTYILGCFGKLSRAVSNTGSKNTAFPVQLELNMERAMNRTIWWKGGKRTIIQDFSVPPGHILVQ